MPRYFLHVHNRIGFLRDEEGQDFAHLNDARDAAVASVRSIIAEEALGGTIDLGGRIDIADEVGQVSTTVPFASAFDLRLDPPAS